MLEPDAARDKALHLVERATRAGADAADAIYVGERSSGVTVRNGELEDVHRSEGEEMGLRVFVGQRSASVAASDLSDDSLAQLVERVLAMAAEAPEDPFAGLAPEELLLRERPRALDLDDGVEPSFAELQARADEADRAALGVDGVTNSSGSSASASASSFAIATSAGFAAATRASGHSCSSSVVAGSGAGMQRDYGWHSARHLEDLEEAGEIGRRAGTRAVARLDPKRIANGTMPVLFDPRVATTLIGHLTGAISGSAVARQATFLLNALGEQIFAPGVRIDDDPHRPRGLRSRAFDGEGLPTRPMALIDDGRLTSWLADSAAARQLGIVPTGHAVRGAAGAPVAGPSNLVVRPGARSRADLLAAFPRAILVTELIGQGVNLVTGDYSRGAAGFLVENGEIVAAVSEITIASTLQKMFATLEPGDDLELRRGIDSPTLLVPEMTVASA